MITEERVLELFAEDNPIPSVDTLDLTHLGSPAYLATLEQRSSEMTQLDTKPVERDQPKRRRLIVVLSTAAAAILIGAVVILTQSEETPAPAVQPTPTTVVDAAPTTVAVLETPTTVAEALDLQVEAAAIAAATGFIEALVAGDLAVAETYALDSVRLSVVRVGNASAGPSGEVAWQEALGWDAVFNGCAISSPDPINTGVTCSVTHSTDISRALGVDPITTSHRYTVMHAGGSYFGQTISQTTVVDDGSLGDTNPNEVQFAEFRNGIFDPFIAWLEENHRGDLEQVMLHAFELGPAGIDVPTGAYMPDFAPESVELWRVYSAEYIAQLGG